LTRGKLRDVAAIPTYLHIGDGLITGGETGVKPTTLPFPLGHQAGLSTMLTEYQRVVPSGPDGVTSGAYLSYYDGAYVRSWTASAGGASTISIAASIWKVDHYAGKTVAITAGTGAGQTRTVASNTANQVTTTTPWGTAPDATSVFNLGPGALVQFHYMPGVLIAGANGDNWFGDASITPTGMLMQRLGQLYNNQPPGFRFLKFGQPSGMPAWKSGGASHTALMVAFNNLAAIEEGLGNTLDVKAVIVDCATTDIFSANLTFSDDLSDVIDTIRATISATALIVIVSPHHRIAKTTFPVSAGVARGAIRDEVVARKAAGDANVALYDMGWGGFTWNLGGAITQEPADPRYYDLPTVIQTGIGLFNVIASHYAPVPVATLAQSLAAVVMLGDSQFVGFGINPLMAFYANQPSMVGTSPTPSATTKSNVWIWDEGMQQLVLYDVMSNSNTFGASGYMGPDVTLPRKLLKRYPQGVVIFKYGKGGMSLTPEGVAGGATGYLENGGTIFEDLKVKWTRCRISALQTLNRSIDVIGLPVCLGENDVAAGEAATTAFENRVDNWIDDARAVFTTRVDGVLPMVWLLGPPPATEVTGGSIHGLAEHRNRYRARIVALEEEKERFKYVRNTGPDGPDGYELSRDGYHYGGESLWRIGDKIAELLLELITSEDAVVEGGTDDGEGEDFVPPGDDEGEAGEDGPGEDAIAPPTTEQEDALQRALYDSPDIKRYRTPTGLEVERFDAEDTIRRAEYARLQAARRGRIGQTVVRFD
jgi:hypothetical protein